VEVRDEKGLAVAVLALRILKNFTAGALLALRTYDPTIGD